MWKHGVKMQSGFTWFRISTSGRSPVATSLNLLDLCTRCAWVGNKRTSLSSLVRLSQGIGWDSGEVRTLQREKKNSCLCRRELNLSAQYCQNILPPELRRLTTPRGLHVPSLYCREIPKSHVINTFPYLCLHGDQDDVRADSPPTHITSNVNSCHYVSFVPQFCEVISNYISDFSEITAAAQHKGSIWATWFLETTS